MAKNLNLIPVSHPGSKGLVHPVQYPKCYGQVVEVIGVLVEKAMKQCIDMGKVGAELSPFFAEVHAR
jgi:hypothetical protein